MLRRVARKDGRFKISNSARDLQVNAVLKSLTVRNETARRIKIPVDICIRESSFFFLDAPTNPPPLSPPPLRYGESSSLEKDYSSRTDRSILPTVFELSIVYSI